MWWTKGRKIADKRSFMFEATQIEYESIILDPADDRLIQSAQR